MVVFAWLIFKSSCLALLARGGNRSDDNVIFSFYNKNAAKSNFKLETPARSKWRSFFVRLKTDFRHSLWVSKIPGFLSGRNSAGCPYLAPAGGAVAAETPCVAGCGAGMPSHGTNSRTIRPFVDKRLHSYYDGNVIVNSFLKKTDPYRLHFENLAWGN